MKIVFKYVEDIKMFAEACEKELPRCDVDIMCDSRQVDGKSPLGIMSFGLNKPLDAYVLTDYSEDLDTFKKIVEPYKI